MAIKKSENGATLVEDGKVYETYEGGYIVFHPDGHTGKTVIYKVVSDTSVLGEIRWYGPWRCYAFYPEMETVYEKKCLRDIADFCELLTTEHKAKKNEQS